MVKVKISAALSAALLSVAPAQADDTVGRVIGAIAQGVLAQQQQEQDNALWTAVVRNGKAAAYRQYLDTYPNGAHAAEARQRLAKMGQAVTGAASGVNIAAAQRNLAILGYYAGRADGVSGRGTVSAITAWQSAHGYRQTGQLTAAEAKLLAEEAAKRGGSGTASATGSRGSEIGLGLSRSDRLQIQRDLNTLGYNVGQPDGLFGSGTRGQISAFQRAQKREATGYLTATDVAALRKAADARGGVSGSDSAGNSAMDEELAGLDRNERIAVQRKLTSLGYSTSGVDGQFGAGTRRAIRNWQGDNGQTVTGYLTADQIRTLNSQTRKTTAASDDGNEAALAAAEQSLLPDINTRRLVEQRLAALGLYRGTVDGVFTSSTRTALKQYQAARNLSQSGYVDTATLTRMVGEAR